MASTITRKRPRRVADLTLDELQRMMNALIDRRLAKRAPTARIAQRRVEISAGAKTTRAEYRAGKVQRGSAKDLMTELE
jgi:hypothetical protein